MAAASRSTDREPDGPTPWRRSVNRKEHPLARATPKNIALVYWASEGDGVSSHLRTYARILAAEGHTVTWYYGSGSAPDIPGVRAEKLAVLDLDGPVPSADEVRAELGPHLATAHIVHVHNGHAFRPEVAKGLASLRDQREREKRPFALLHTFHSPFNGKKEDRNAEAVKAFSGTFGVSQYMADFYRQKLGIDVQAITIGVETARFAGVPDVALTDKESVVFGMAARMVPNKGVLESVRAFAEVVRDSDCRTQGAKPQLRIASPARSVGAEYERADGYEETVKGIAEEIVAVEPDGSRRNLVHFENCTGEEMPGFYGRVHVMLSPTIAEEAFGLTVAESQAAGRVVISTDVGGLREALDPKSGRLLPRHGPEDSPVKPDDVVADLAQAMLPLARNRAQVTELGCQARNFARRRLGAGRHAQRTLLAYYLHGAYAVKGGARNRTLSQQRPPGRDPRELRTPASRGFLPPRGAPAARAISLISPWARHSGRQVGAGAAVEKWGPSKTRSFFG
ncbi:hypothetical protein GCM10023205_53100 [Yinghuangia aomiensis]|uniref:D-inositol 3-phosphate glycosyltransferase n=1 Tax=Yinghuangia aomiensis TaxID=676205 RepID=A0ABP9HTR7_9ACTN